MSPDEFDQVLHDTEVKLARLRALYEQYFQGIEKLEPHVARKDMDRSVELLRKSLPRNTALRFRMQQLAARYGTYITYWQRISRQIEEGTYKRDILRAQRSKSAPSHHGASEEASAWEIEVDVDAIEEADFRQGFDDSDVDAILGALGTKSAAPKAMPKDAETSPTPGAAPLVAAKPAGLSVFGKAPAPKPGAAPLRTGLSAFGPAMGRTQGSVAAPLPQGPRPVTPKPAEPPKAAESPKPVGPPKPAVSAPQAAPAPKPAAPAVAPAPVRPPQAAFPRPAESPAPPIAKPIAKPLAPVPPPAAAAAPAVVRHDGAVDGAAMKALYDRYTSARKQNNEAAVRFETLEESVQKMVPKLKEKYGNKRVDFDVVVQNGRVGLKPKVTE